MYTKMSKKEAYKNTYRLLRSQDAILHKIWKGESVSNFIRIVLSIALEASRIEDIVVYTNAIRSFNDRYAEPIQKG